MNKDFSDNRGKLIFPIKNNFDFKQCTVSCNKKNVFRGIHINSFKKLVTCVQGKILDIIINFDTLADDYLVPKYYTLDPSSDLFQISIPPNYGHAFLSLEEDSILIYHLSDEYNETNTKHIHFLDPFINIILPTKLEDLLISDKDDIKNFIKPIDYIVFGANGFLGSSIVYFLKKFNKNFIISELRLHEIEKIRNLLTIYSPKYIINCAGLCGTPNLFWCDTHKIETIETNITYQLTLANICKELGIHLTIFGSAGIFNNDKIYSENNKGNNFKNFYGECKIYLENIVKNYNNVLYLRINYPISDKPSNRNLLTKLLNYKIIDPCDISITYIDNLFPILLQMMENNEVGICNFTNPGHINLTEIIKLYNSLSNEPINFLLNNEFNINETKRSFSTLDSYMLQKYNPLNIEYAVNICIKNYISNLNNYTDRKEK